MLHGHLYIFDGSLKETSIDRGAPHRILREVDTSTTGPLVSCLMVTRGDIAFVRESIAQFKQQTYGNRELVIVCGAPTAELERLVEESGNDVRLVRIGEGLSLGQLRNASIESARGDIVCLWDDDDLYGSQRLEHGVSALRLAQADALFLRQLFIWCPAQRVLSLSRSRVWEGSMIAFKQALVPYPDLPRGEDTVMVESILQQRVIALLDAPLSYCYCIHGNNTSTAPHMQVIIDGAKIRFDYGKAVAAFSSSFGFPAHPATTETDRVLPAEAADDGSQLWRLQLYMSVSQFLRRMRRVAADAWRPQRSQGLQHGRQRR